MKNIKSFEQYIIESHNKSSTTPKKEEQNDVAEIKKDRSETEPETTNEDMQTP